MTVTEARNLAASLVGAGASIRPTPARPAESRPACNMTHARIIYHGRVVCSCGDFNCASLDAPEPRRMVAVTIALSEPADGPELDWSETLAALVRLTFANTSVEVIDSWRVDA